VFEWVRSGARREKQTVLDNSTSFRDDKAVGDLHWRTALDVMTHTQQMIERAGWQQTAAQIDFGNIGKPITVICVSDLHYGAISTDHEVIKRLFDDIISTPDLYVILAGDLEHMSINPRGVAEFTEGLVPPIIQHAITESIIEDLAPKILFSCYDNHSVMRQENGSGMSEYARLMSRNTIYMGGIGHADVRIGGEVYRIALSHRFRGSTGANPTAGQKKYMLMEAPDREIAIGGDIHTPALSEYVNGPIHRLAINIGTAQLTSPYAQRFFSLFSHPVFPCFTLSPDEHLFSGLWSLRHLRALQRIVA
jgi:hypothetical protein